MGGTLIKVQLSNNSEGDFTVWSSTTGKQLKEFIFNSPNNSLAVEEMGLFYNNLPISDTTTITSLGKNLKIVQKKINFLMTVKLQNNTQHEIALPLAATGKQLKQRIFSSLSDNLRVDSMNLYHNTTKIEDNLIVSSIIVPQGTKLLIKQNKGDLADAPNVCFNAEDTDEITQEQGTAKMSCGHYIGRDHMTQLVRSLITAKKY